MSAGREGVVAVIFFIGVIVVIFAVSVISGGKKEKFDTMEEETTDEGRGYGEDQSA
jgi:hypothetical protein